MSQRAGQNSVGPVAGRYFFPEGRSRRSVRLSLRNTASVSARPFREGTTASDSSPIMFIFTFPVRAGVRNFLRGQSQTSPSAAADPCRQAVGRV